MANMDNYIRLGIKVAGAAEAASELEKVSKKTRSLEEAENSLAEAQKDRFDSGSEGGGIPDGGIPGVASFIKNNKDAIAGAAKGAAAFAAINLAAQSATASMENAIGKLQEVGVDIDKLKEDNRHEFAFFESVKAIAHPLETVKNLVGKIWEASINGLIDLDGLKRSAIQSQDMVHGLERMKAAIEDINKADKALRLDNLRQSSILLKAENDELERRQKLLNAERSLASTEGRVNDQARIAKGEDPGVVGAQRKVMDAALETEKLKDGLAKLDLAVREAALGLDNSRAAENEMRGEIPRFAMELELATKAVADARFKLSMAQAKGEVGEKEAAGVRASELAFDEAKRAYEGGKQAVDKATTDSLAAEQTFESALKDFENKQQTNALQLREISTKATEEIKNLANEANSEVTAQVQAAMDLISAAAAEQGGKISTGAKQSLDSLGQIISDNIPDSQQIEAIRANFMVLQSTTEGRNAAFAEALGAMTQALQKAAADTSKILSEITSVQSNQAGITSALNNVAQTNQMLKSQINQISSR